MKPLTNRLRDASKRYKVARDIIEVDYIISYMLTGIYAQPELQKSLVFKGGTALKKLFFGEYRFSEDLDFSTRSAPTGEVLENLLSVGKAESERMLQEHGTFSISLERHTEKEPHPDGQEAFIYRVTFPWQNEALCRIKVEISHNEQVLLEPDLRNLIHGYEEDFAVNISSLRLEEIVVEKMRSLLQTRRKFERGENRPRPRDFYDLWRVMNQFGKGLNKKMLGELLKPKCDFKKVHFESLDDFFDMTIVNEAGKFWKSNLGRLVPDLPEFDAVMNDLRALIPRYFDFSKMGSSKPGV